MEKINQEDYKKQQPEIKSEKSEQEYKIIEENVRTSYITKSGSKTSKYLELVIGEKRIWALLKYEIITGIFSNWPGALGIFLRGIFYRLLFKKVGKGVIFGQNITIRHPNKIFIGDNVVIDENCMLDAKGSENKGIEISRNCYIGRNTILSCKNGDIFLDENVNIGFNCEIHSSSYVKIGKNTLIAAYVYVIAGDHIHDVVNKPISLLGGISKGIIIGENCWLGARSTIFDSVSIGNDVIVGASAVVNSDVPAYSVAAGIPARIVKNRLQKEKEE
ncbi:MAG: acyltransferase [Actinobacteria bacterium]|nr:acyltransferase [Actinomycetota bacterium]